MVSAAQEGLKPPPFGDRVVKLAHQPEDPTTNQAIYKTFTAGNWPSGVAAETLDYAPSNVSARYVTYLCVPAARFSLSRQGWTTLVQFTETYTSTDGATSSQPAWRVGVGNVAGRPVLDVSYAAAWHVGPEADFTQYMDRWIKVEMRLYQGDRLEVLLDETLLDTAYDDEYPVGRRFFPGAAGAFGDTVESPRAWTISAGNISNPAEWQTTSSVVYVDLVTVLPLEGTS